MGGGAGRVRVLALITPQKPLPTVILNLFQNLTRVKNKLSTKTTTFLQSHALSRLVGGLAALLQCFLCSLRLHIPQKLSILLIIQSPNTGSGDGEKYYKWENTENGLQLTETDKQNAQITAKYDTTQSHTWLENRTDNSAMNITGGSFVNQTFQDGGAITNTHGSIGNISSDFVGNYFSRTSVSGTAGGAIYNSNSGTIGDITGDFIGNYVSGPTADGGAISNNWHGTIGQYNRRFHR